MEADDFSNSDRDDNTPLMKRYGHAGFNASQSNLHTRTHARAHTSYLRPIPPFPHGDVHDGKKKPQRPTSATFNSISSYNNSLDSITHNNNSSNNPLYEDNDNPSSNAEDAPSLPSSSPPSSPSINTSTTRATPSDILPSVHSSIFSLASSTASGLSATSSTPLAASPNEIREEHEHEHAHKHEPAHANEHGHEHEYEPEHTHKHEHEPGRESEGAISRDNSQAVAAAHPHVPDFYHRGKVSVLFITSEA